MAPLASTKPKYVAIRCSTCHLVFGCWELSHVISHAEKERTACKDEQIHKMTILTQNGGFLLFGPTFFTALRSVLCFKLGTNSANSALVHGRASYFDFNSSKQNGIFHSFHLTIVLIVNRPIQKVATNHSPTDSKKKLMMPFCVLLLQRFKNLFPKCCVRTNFFFQFWAFCSSFNAEFREDFRHGNNSSVRSKLLSLPNFKNLGFFSFM